MRFYNVNMNGRHDLVWFLVAKYFSDQMRLQLLNYASCPSNLSGVFAFWSAFNFFRTDVHQFSYEALQMKWNRASIIDDNASIIKIILKYKYKESILIVEFVIDILRSFNF